ncbi:hypothetical protein SAMN04515655_11065 [Halanaerobium congolense]|jgi:hypothetical protein|uniref:Uncharacterized protein n=1 Tax=Halanaerobium congolense TaxID=54121 RepID=A0A1G6NFI3_9FIRM|nr:MAG: hypothetical protein AWL62_1679 [Halanaerobium sp. T82-1]PXV62439.1 hypothetical protein C8C78_1338 [Halanaerobium congolense]TDP11560.1 hypothetical protein C8C79_13514 [Halanaerobium congolense]TDS32235.1 hypothetical protein BY453_10828 [Halanaerobium congolense]TDX41395.1 hypothetical protein C7954_12714 [Halanaerobium congolense]
MSEAKILETLVDRFDQLERGWTANSTKLISVLIGLKRN